ncbi:NAC domain-containing protein 101 [Ricinus communis]|uniref:NAC domain-containing protein 101 n=1 Tax=Ricinus communis TaxID=3988 RepID=UPI000772B293|nr:NAC domain-containing protein 101 [Ricinus communis]XP_025012427.1 NAC domain-containing protein 101 [Ricinus communis]|eukprot:XP_015572333.1 NAC domain-containing protein 101 [Ricinus communis]
MNGRVGYRFHPTDEELVSYFLRHKIDGHDFLVDDDIHVIDLCKFDPWDLPGFASQGSNDQVWYFFYRRELKYKSPSKPRYNRTTATGTGHWKPTGAERLVKAKRTKRVIGVKRTLVFYLRGTPKEVKTNWVIHEYEPKTSPPHQADLVLCKLKEKADNKADTSGCDEGESSHNGPSDIESPQIEIPVSEVDQELLLESILAGNGVNPNHPSAEQPRFHIEEGISIEDLMSTDVFDNGSDDMTFQFHTNEPEEDPFEMADSFLDLPDEFSGEGYLCSNSADHNVYSHESARTHHNHSGSPQSLSGVYLDDFSDMEAEIVYGKSSQFGASNLNNHAREYRQTRRIQALTETFPPSRYENSRTSKHHVHHGDILLMEASSADSASTEEIKCVGVVGKNYPVNVKQGSSTSTDISVKKEVVTPRRSHIQRKIPAKSEQKAKEARNQVTAINLPRESPKESIIMKTEKDQKMGSTKPNLNVKTNEMPGNEKTGSFIRLETSLLSQRPIPLSVYIVNVFVGLLLFYLILSFEHACL